MASVTRESLRGVFVTEMPSSAGVKEIELIENRLSAISKKNYVLERLSVDLRIFIKTEEEGLKEFTVTEQKALISKVLADKNLYSSEFTQISRNKFLSLC